MKSHKEECEIRVIWKNKNGELHREDGPAVIFDRFTKLWFIDGERFECADFEELHIKRYWSE